MVNEILFVYDDFLPDLFRNYINNPVPFNIYYRLFENEAARNFSILVNRGVVASTESWAEPAK